jgi:hypothetical protein
MADGQRIAKSRADRVRPRARTVCQPKPILSVPSGPLAVGRSLEVAFCPTGACVVLFFGETDLLPARLRRGGYPGMTTLKFESSPEK